MPLVGVEPTIPKAIVSKTIVYTVPPQWQYFVKQVATNGFREFIMYPDKSSGKILLLYWLFEPLYTLFGESLEHYSERHLSSVKV